MQGSITRNSIELILTLLPFMIGIGIFLGFIYLRSVLSRYSELIKKQMITIRELQNHIRDVTSRSEQYSSSDPEPYGVITVGLRDKLVLATQDILALNEFYGRNVTLFRHVSHPNIYTIKGWISGWNELNLSLANFLVVEDRLENIFREIEDDFNRLADISVEVSQKSKLLFDSIHQSKDRLAKIEAYGLTDDETESVSTNLNQWEQTALHQIPIYFMAEKPLNDKDQADKILVAKVLRLLNRIEPEITALSRKINSWEVEFQAILELQENIPMVLENIHQIIESLSNDVTLPVDCGEFRIFYIEHKSKVEDETRPNLTAKLINSRLARLRLIDKACFDKYSQLESIKKQHSELLGHITNRRLIHKMEWVKNAQKVMNDAREYNQDNWTEDIDVEKLKGDMVDLSRELEVTLPAISSGIVTERQLKSLFVRVSIINKDYLSISHSFKIYFDQLKQLRAIEETLINQVGQYHATLRQLSDIISTHPTLSKNKRNHLGYFLNSITSLSSQLSDRTNGKIDVKKSKWESDKKKIDRTVSEIGKKMESVTFNLTVEVSNQMDILQDYLVLNEPVFLNALNAVKNGSTNQDGSKFQDNNQTILVVVQHIKDLSQTWHKLSASKKALMDVSVPVTERLNKLDRIRTDVLRQMQIVDEKVPANRTWPPTNKSLHNERLEFNKLENEFNALKSQKNTAIQLMAVLSDLAEKYRDLSLSLKSELAEVDIEQKRFVDLEKRMNQSKKLWNDLTKAYPGNMILGENIQELLESIEKDHKELKKRYQDGRLPYSQAFQMMRVICRKLDQESIEFDNLQVINISGEVHQRL